MKRTFVMPLFLSLSASLLHAQGTGKATAPPAPAPTTAAAPAPAAPLPADAAKPAPELTKLQFLVGDWVHDEVYDPTGSAAKGAARSKNAWILGDHQLYLVYKSNSPRGVYEGRGFMGWDPDAKAYRLAWFDNTGLAQVYTGTFDPEESLIFSGEYTTGGQRVRQQLTIKKQPGGKFLLTDQMASGDGPLKVSLESLAAPAPAPASSPSPAASPATPAAPTPTTPASSK
jgi:hypothetical protein